MFAVRNQFISGALFCYLKINTNSSLLPSLIIPRGSSCSAGGEFWQGEGEIWNFILFCSGERVNKVFFPFFCLTSEGLPGRGLNISNLKVGFSLPFPNASGDRFLGFLREIERAIHSII